MIQKITSLLSSGANFLSRTLTKLSTFALVAALILIVWKGPWIEGLQGKQLDFLGWSLLGSIAVWAICTLNTENAVRDFNFKAAGVEASVDFNEIPHKSATDE